MTLETGIFDQYDLGTGRAADALHDHLAFAIEADRLGIDHYHVTEHHGSPLSVAPPSLVLAALAPITERIRLGALVNILPATHPFRLAEEIAFLDQLSGGRLDVGVGSGVSPYELGYIGVDAAQGKAVFAERFPQLVELLATGRAGLGELPLRPLQERIPLWYASSSGRSAEWAGRNGVNFIGWWTPEFPELAAMHRAAAAEAGHAVTFGLASYIVIGDTDAAAQERFRRAFAHFGARSMLEVWWRHGDHAFDFLGDPQWRLDHGHAIVGTVETVRERLAERIASTGAGLVQGQLFFGDMTRSEAIENLTAFATEVAPGLR